MKVSTDACILGAWFASKMKGKPAILDIGSGTGLLMLMLAQKNESLIDGIELDPTAYLQLKANLELSKWRETLTPIGGDARNYSFLKKYDFIISNPPFFENDLLSPSMKKNQSKHDSTLMLAELVGIVEENLDTNGSFGLLLPHRRAEWMIELCKSHQFFLNEELLMRQTPAHDFFRAVLHFSRTQKEPLKSDELVIKDESGQYTASFTALMKDYYLYL